jgi:diguanylate cyclase (GGDEF)-like protein
MHFINNKICKPINLIENTIENFKYDSISDRFNNVSEMEALQLHTGNEVESLYNSFMATIKENVFYIDNFKKAENTISEIQVTAYKDQLTKVGNSNKYKVDMDLLDKRIGNGTARFAVVLADINNLKYINDTYGHDIGDRYIIGCCKVLCDVFKHSAVYRIGGDEFVCISENEDYDSISLLVEQCTAIFESYDESRATAPYERYSMALGFAVFNDHFINAESVVKVADEQMYKNKAEHKKKYGSYR